MTSRKPTRIPDENGWAPGKPSVLDVGCGRNKVPGAIGLDRFPLEGVDVIHDLQQFPYPFSNDYFDHIHAHHVIEHLPDVGPFMAELNRIAKPGGLLYLSTPHYSSMGSWRDPTHYQHFSIYTFEYFTRRHPADYYSGSTHWEIVQSEIRMLRLWRLTGIEWLINLADRYPQCRWLRKFWEEYTAFIFRAREIRVILRARK